MSTTVVRAAVCQLAVGSDKAQNLENAARKIAEAATAGAKLVVLPECFTCPYGNEHFPVYAERATDGPTSRMLSSAARTNRVYLVGGSFPERDDDGRLYNTSLTYGPDGSLLGKHRKLHMFDIDVPGKITFKESATLSPGQSLTIIDTEFARIGIGICYDMRFAAMAMVYAQRGCTMLVYPGAFNMTTGPAHWELLQRARAVDNQVYVLTASPARGTSGYIAWGHSTIVGPWGDVLATTEHDEAIVYADLPMARVGEVRQQIPIRQQQRTDLYMVSDLTARSDA